MLKQSQTPRLILVISLIVMAAASRLLPHPPNFTAMGAMALFGGALIGNRVLALTLPLVALLVSDLFLGLDIHTFAGVYIAFVLMAVIGLMMRSRISFLTVTTGAVVGSVLFFLISNGWDWAANPMYPQTGAGLIAAYAAGLAFYTQEVFGNFFFNTLMANVFFSWALFGAYHLVTQNSGELTPIKIRSNNKQQGSDNAGN